MRLHDGIRKSPITEKLEDEHSCEHEDIEGDHVDV